MARDLFAAASGRSGVCRALIVAMFAAAALALPASASAEPPALTIEPVTSSSIVTAEVSGEVDANGIGTIWFFEVSHEEEGGGWSGWSTTNLSSYTEGTNPETVGGVIEGLKAGTTYQVRLGAFNFEEFVNYYSEEPNPEFTTDPAVVPALTLGPAEDETSDSAHLSGTINPEGGNQDAVSGLLPITWQLQVNRENPKTHALEGWSSVGSGVLTGAEAESTSPITVEADATGLQPNSHYHYRLLVHYAGREEEASEGGNAGFDTEALEPDVERETLFNPTPTSIQLRAKVNPHNSDLSDCHFEYGIGGALNQSVPCKAENIDHVEVVELPDDNNFTAVFADVSNLTPATSYDFRLVVTNGVGTTEGDIRSFTSLEEAAPEACPNEEIRIQQHATQLPDCRAYEKVTPAEKGGGDIMGSGMTNLSSAEGDAVTLATHSPFGDIIGSGPAGLNQYIARRTPTGWIDHGIDPRPRPEEFQTFAGSTRYFGFSEDLRRALLVAADLPDAPGGIPLRNNLYLENTADRSLEVVTATHDGLPDVLPHPFLDALREQGEWGLSADARHAAFALSANFLPQVTPGVVNMYQWDNGVLSLAGILPDGSVPPGGSFLPEPSTMDWAMSRDGSRQLFFASANPGGPPQLYQRIDGQRTVWISEPETSEPGEKPTGVKLEDATPDGHTIIFSTNSRLLDEDEHEGPDLYRWTDSPDPESESNLTLITPNGFEGQGAGKAQVVGASDDGTKVYYKTAGGEMVLWNSGTTKVIIPVVDVASAAPEQLTVAASPGFGRVSPNGRYLAFVVKSSFQTVGLTGTPTDKHYELYLYDAGNETLTCPSCPSGHPTCVNECRPKPGEGIVTPTATTDVIGYNMPGVRPRFLSDNGRVFFSSPEPLAPGDVNGTYDAYEYEASTGKRSLLSTGRGGGRGTSFSEADVHGNNVFIVTRQELVPSDTDGLADLYDVRVGGGYPESEPPPPGQCAGEDCQAAAASSAQPPGIASAAKTRGNVKPRRCRAAKAKHHRKKGRACSRKHHKHRKAGTTGRAGR
jgi:hypothetical protein